MINNNNVNRLNFEGSWSILTNDLIQQRLTQLSDESVDITQKNSTERPFMNEFWDFSEEGLFVDIVSGEPLFSSVDKFDSGTGWPSFSNVIHPELIVELKDYSHGMERIEVRSRYANSHLGHLFFDGPTQTQMRYCINSAALKFISKSELIDTEYERYLSLF
jgi:methionine-R-sulfoxide reductase